MSTIGNIQTTQYGNAVALNAAKAAGAEGGQSIEAQIMSVMAMGYETNVQIMKNKVQEYRSQLKLQQSYNDALAKLESYNAGFKSTDPATKRQNDTSMSAGAVDKMQKAFSAAGNEASFKSSATKPYADIVSGMTGVTESEKTQFAERAAIADMAKTLGVAETGAHNDFNAFVKGDATKGFVDGMKAKLKGAMDAIGADLQLAMIDIQTVKGRMDQMMTAMTQMAKSTADKGESIARNL